MLNLLLVSLLSLNGMSKSVEAIAKKDGEANAAAFVEAIEVNIPKEFVNELAPIVAAIRYAENGRAGREFGILNSKADNFRKQAGWCAATVYKNHQRWIKAGKKGKFITFLGNRYCPIGADNDPDNLNQHWITNVNFFVRKFK